MLGLLELQLCNPFFVWLPGKYITFRLVWQKQKATCVVDAGGFPLQKGWSDGIEYEPAYFLSMVSVAPPTMLALGSKKQMTTCLLRVQKVPQPGCDLWDGLGSHGLTFCSARSFFCHLYTKTNDLILGQGAL